MLAILCAVFVMAETAKQTTKTEISMKAKHGIRLKPAIPVCIALLTAIPFVGEMKYIATTANRPDIFETTRIFDYAVIIAGLSICLLAEHSMYVGFRYLVCSSGKPLTGVLKNVVRIIVSFLLCAYLLFIEWQFVCSVYH